MEMLIILVVGFFAVMALMLLGVHTLLAVCRGVDRFNRSPFGRLGPWFDYVAATGVLVALVALAALLT